MVDTIIIQIITAASMGVGAILGIQQLRASWIRRTEKTEERIQDWIAKSDERLLQSLDKNAEATNSRFEKDEEDIEDIEDDMKQMVKQFRDMCDKLSKHDYVIDRVEPEFHKLKTEFYKFKNAVDTNYKVGFTGVHTNDRIDDPENER